MGPTPPLFTLYYSSERLRSTYASGKGDEGLHRWGLWSFGVENSPVLCKDPDAVELAPLFDEPKLSLGLDRLIEASQSRTVCLMCGCLRPHRCHRFRLVGEALARRGIEVIHLDDKGEPVTQAQVAEQAKPLQTSLF